MVGQVPGFGQLVVFFSVVVEGAGLAPGPSPRGVLLAADKSWEWSQLLSCHREAEVPRLNPLSVRAVE